MSTATRKLFIIGDRCILHNGKLVFFFIIILLKPLQVFSPISQVLFLNHPFLRFLIGFAKDLASHSDLDDSKYDILHDAAHWTQQVLERFLNAYSSYRYSRCSSRFLTDVVARVRIRVEGSRFDSRHGSL